MKIFFVLFGFIFLAKFISAQSNKKAEEKKILSARTASNLSIAKHDIEGMSKFWLPDFVLVRGNSMISSGKEANINAWKELVKQTRRFRTQGIRQKFLSVIMIRSHGKKEPG